MFIVEDVFLIEGRGVVVVGHIGHDEAYPFKTGDVVTITRPDGSQVQAHVRGLNDFTRCFTDERAIGVLLGGVLSREEAPVGSKVSVQES